MNFLRVRRVHFVGIGGVGMSGLAEILSSVGLTVTGSDLREGEETLRLRALGIPVFAAGHRAEHVAGADVVVYSSAVAEDNPELVAARIAGVPVIKRAEMLAEVMRVKTGIAIAGSHGKTTTTSMTGSILQAAGLDPTIVVGGRVRAMGTNACLGKGEYLVAEADEFDRSFLRLRPIVAVVNNIDLEHLDTYRDLADLKASFTEFASTVPFFGAALLGLDDPNVQEIRPLLASRVRVGTFGLTPQADVTARDLALERTGSRFTAVAEGEVIGPVEVSLPGLHNVKNALAAIAIARELDVPFEACVKALSTFAGVARRFERKGERDGVLVVDDYAHHPTEVSATLGAARQAYPERRLVVLFQPHLFTRTRDQAAGFGAALLGLDDPNVQEIRPLLASRVRVGTFGLTPQADVTARDLGLDRNGSRFTAVADGEVLGPVEVSLPGLHNVKNALAAIAISRELEIPFEACARTLATFAGVARRFEWKGERGGVLVVDDYAHHPTEVAATLGAARQAHPERRLVVLFQPHLFTRTRDQADGFGAALLAADVVYVLPVYPSREAPIPGITSRLVSGAARSRGHRNVADLDDRASAVARLEAELRDGDLLVTMGAGDVNRVGEEFLAAGGAA